MINKIHPITKVGLIFLLTVTLVASTLFPTLAKADSQKYWFPNDSIKNEAERDGMFSIELDILTDAAALMGFTRGNRQSYIMVSTSPDGHKSYAFNTPNVAGYIYNCLGRLMGGGWNGTMYDTKSLKEKRDGVTLNTAKERYTYELPTPIYLGEYPYPQYDFNDLTSGFFGIGVAATVVLTITTGGAFGILAGLYTTIVDKLKKAVTGEGVKITFEAGDIKTISYNTLDYTDNNNTSGLNMNLKRMSMWIEQNWESLKSSIATQLGDAIGELFGGGHHLIEVDGRDIFDDDYIVPKGKTVGSGDDQMHGDEVLNKLIEKAGDSTPIVLNGMISVGTSIIGGCQPPYDYTLRYMPYDMSTMSKSSQEYMGYKEDPRVLTFKRHSGPFGLVGLTLTEIGHSMNCSWLLSPTKALCETADNMNSICDLEFFEQNNIDLFYGWKGGIGHIIMVMLALLAVIIVLKGVLDFLRNKGGRKGSGSVVLRTIVTVLLLGLAIGLLANPEKTSKGIVNVSSSIMSIGQYTLSMDPNFRELYVDGNDGASKGEVSSLRYWAVYFNVWSGYALNTNINSNGNFFNPSEGRNEYTAGYDKSPAVLKNDTRINLWNVALLEELTTNDFNNANRTIDHFMAPVITPTGNNTFSVENNKYWSGRFPYTVAPFAGILIALSVFLMTLMKFLCFIELALDLMLIFLRVITGAFQGKARVKEQFKDLFQDFVRVFTYDVLITALVFLSFVQVGGAEILLALIVTGVTVGLIWWLLMSPNGSKSMLRPAMFKLFHKIIKRVTAIAKKGINDAKTAFKAAKGDYAGAAKDVKKRIDEQKDGEQNKKNQRNKENKKMDDGSESNDRRSNTNKDDKNNNGNNKGGGIKEKASAIKDKAVDVKDKAVSAKNKVQSGVNTAKHALDKAKNIKLPGRRK